MPTITLTRSVAAPIERCFDLSRSVDFHLESARGSKETVIGGVRNGLLSLGEEVTWRARHLGAWRTLSSAITAFQRPTWFRDSMVRGAFRRFDHDHRFAPDPRVPGRTILTDVFDFTSPLGPLGRVANALILTSHMRTFLSRRLDALVHALESEEWRRYLAHDPMPLPPSVRRPEGPEEEALPLALRELLVREGHRAARVEDVTALSGRGSPRLTFRIELVDGRSIKGRILRDEEVGARMSRWLPLLEPHGFAPLLAVGGTATLEAWLTGRPVRATDEAAAEAAGELLGACHALVPREAVGQGDPRLEGWIADTERRIHAIREQGLCTKDRARDVLVSLHAARPAHATWGLRHGDFHPDNLLVTDAGLRAIDNTTVGPALLETDLGFAWNRWPLTSPQRERFLMGYARLGAPGPFLAHERFWGISTALWSLAYRIAEGTGGVDVPLQELARHVP